MSALGSNMTMARLSVSALALAAAVGFACAGTQNRPPEVVTSVPLAQIPGHASIVEDTSPKEELRMVPPEAYLKTYLQLFGGESPLDVQKEAREGGLFDTWDDYFAALGFPDYRTDYPRATQSNAMMMATFERLGIALCDRAVERDLKANPPLAKRRLFSFELPSGGKVDEASFATRFDVLHRRFLGYPAKLAETDRTKRFFELYEAIEKDHSAKGAPKSRFSAQEASWAAVCYGLVRHPEFHLY